MFAKTLIPNKATFWESKVEDVDRYFGAQNSTHCRDENENENIDPPKE